MFNYYYIHVPTNTEWKPNGSGGIVRKDLSSNQPLPIWITKNSKDWKKISIKN